MWPHCYGPVEAEHYDGEYVGGQSCSPCISQGVKKQRGRGKGSRWRQDKLFKDTPQWPISYNSAPPPKVSITSNHASPRQRIKPSTHEPLEDIPDPNYSSLFPSSNGSYHLIMQNAFNPYPRFPIVLTVRALLKVLSESQGKLLAVVHVKIRNQVLYFYHTMALGKHSHYKRKE